MLMVRSHGQLGNQVFHLLAALSVKRANEKLVLFGFGELLELVPELTTSHVVIPVPNRFSNNLKFLERGARQLARRGIIGRAHYREGSRRLVRTDGAVSLALLDAGNAQNYRAIDEQVLKDFFGQIGQGHGSRQVSLRGPGNGLSCFVHIRRGDYLSHPSVEESIAIPDSWYLKQMTFLACKGSDVRFLVYSDDLDSLAEEIANFPNTHFRNVDQIDAFWEMAWADMGILSASTFSWWPTMIATQRGAKGPFIGPRHWAGWRNGVWDPEGFFSEALTYIDVDASHRSK